VNPNVQRFICPLCNRTHATDKPHIECEYCAQEMVPMVIWVRRQSKKNKGSNGSQKETDK
jgi:hypothetical protein